MLVRGLHGSQPRGALGIYGFEIHGLREPEALLLEAPPGSPRLRIECDHGDAVTRTENPRSPVTVRVGRDSAEVGLIDGGRMTIDRETLTVRLSTREPLRDEVILQPYLGLPAAIASHWLGRQTLHGGAFRHEERAWAVVGGMAAGKSSILGWLLHRGHEIVADDLLLLSDGTLFAGPRSVDLRPASAARLGGQDLGVVGTRKRWRLRAGDVPASVRLAGVVYLDWGERVQVEPLGAEERLTGLVRNCALRPRHEESPAYLELAALPAWRFVRPRDLDRLDEANLQLLEALA